MSEYNTIPLQPARNIAPPPGWNLAEQFDPFEAFLGPYFERTLGGAREFAFRIDDRHTNAQHVAHGGALLTFADACLGYAIWDATDRAPCVTISQQSQFLRPAFEGDLIACRPQIERKTRSLLFIRCDFSVKTHVVFTVTALWRIWPKA